jgi:glycogen operon protein
LGARFLGSADYFDRGGRRPQASVNFLSAHDGFTLADTTAYNERHNEANGEDNRDGHGTNHSDNCGVEGPTDDPAVLETRRRRRRNMLATLFLSQGAPMLLAGDEFGNSQGGNNNAYNQDNPISWLDWPQADWDQVQFVADLSAFRRAHHALRQCRFLHGLVRDSDGCPDVLWRDLAVPDELPDWDDPELGQLGITLRGCAEAPDYARSDDVVLVIFNRSDRAAAVQLPEPRPGFHWSVGIDTSAKTQVLRPHKSLRLTAPALSVLALVEKAEAAF